MAICTLLTLSYRPLLVTRQPPCFPILHAQYVSKFFFRSLLIFFDQDEKFPGKLIVRWNAGEVLPKTNTINISENLFGKNIPAPGSSRSTALFIEPAKNPSAPEVPTRITTISTDMRISPRDEKSNLGVAPKPNKYKYELIPGIEEPPRRRSPVISTDYDGKFANAKISILTPSETPIVVPTKPPVTPQPVIEYKCHITGCNKSFKTDSELHDHVKIHEQGALFAFFSFFFEYSPKIFMID